MGGGGMTTITTYGFRAESADALRAMLRNASEGRERAHASEESNGALFIDEARVKRPVEETTSGTPIETLDPQTGEAIVTVPRMATGFWLGEVVLVDETDATLAALPESVTTDDQAASG